MINILIGFLPWILYFFLIGATQARIDLAVIVAFVALLVTNFKELKKGFILAWGGLLYFSVMLVMMVILKSQWFMHHTWILSNGTLAAISWFSLAVKKPFTLQYAREKVAEELWQHPMFIRVNVILTVTWALVFTFCMSLHLIQLYTTALPAWLYQILTNGLSVLAVIITIKFPDFYRQYSRDKLKRKTASSRFLQGNFKPVRDELTVENLEVVGEIPNDLNGAYMRNGPNPAFDPISYTYPFDGDGMIHAVYIKHGKASYRNRYVQTDGLKIEQRAGKAVYGGILYPIEPDKQYFSAGEQPEKFKNGAFINIIQEHKKLLALYEGDCAYTLDFELNTTGKWKPGTKDPLHVGPHPRLDPINGERWFINYNVEPPFVQLHCIDANGALTKSYPIDSEYPVMIHDFLLTKHYAIFFQCPVVFDMEAAQQGGDVLAWRPELGTRIGIVARATGKVEWLQTDAFFVFHYANAYEKDNKIIIDYARHSDFQILSNVKTKIHFSLARTYIDLQNKSVHNEEIDTGDVLEFPRIREDKITLENRFIYLMKKDNSDAFNCVMKYDMQQSNSSKHQFNNNIEAGETIFVPRKNSKAEDDGYLMLFVYDKQANNSELVILDATNISDKPLAKIKMPRRIPNGLHGNWIE